MNANEFRFATAQSRSSGYLTRAVYSDEDLSFVSCAPFHAEFLLDTSLTIEHTYSLIVYPY